MMPHSEQSKMARALRRQGYQVTVDGHGHWRVCDSRGRWLANFPATTADWRWRDKLRTAIRRRERELQAQEKAS